MTWRWASASVIGSSHIHHCLRLQDAYAVSKLGDDFIFAIVSDGAGSAKFAAYGAWVACRFLTVQIREWLRVNPKLPTDEQLTEWVEELRAQISAIASHRGKTARQFAATLAAIVIAPDEVVTLHIGDSAIVGRSTNGEWRALCWPENGEYASSTYFITDVPKPRLNIVRHQEDYDAFALFSDGVGDLALSHLDHVAHPGFFDPMLHPIDNARGQGRLRELSTKLATYLAGPTVCDRTDDDKTLILISRR